MRAAWRGPAGMAGFAWLNARRTHPHRPALRRHWFGAKHTTSPGDWHSQQPGKRSTMAWLVTLTRAGYGMGLVAVPGPLIGLTGQVPGRRACAVARVLGVRHLVQAGITVGSHSRESPQRGELCPTGGA
ncbi:MAG TPA: hypothetical protein VGL88_04420 [Pseudonocardiaceae bacterium]